MKTWADLADAVLDDVPGCSAALATKALRYAAQVLCEQTRAWRVTLPAQATTAGTDTYAFQLPADADLVKLTGATIDGQDANLLLAGQDRDGNSGILALDVHNYRVVPTPGGVYSVVLTVALAPADTAAGLDDTIATRYKRALVMGAKAELFGMKKQPFSDAAAATDERARFDDEIGRIRIAVARAFSGAPLRVRPSFM